MLRNECDILPVFLKHLSGLFERGYLLNHRSVDGSGEILSSFAQSHSGFRVFNLDFTGYHQREISETFMKKAFAEGADLVFFLDADEFVDVSDKAKFDRLCESLAAQEALGFMPWRNIIMPESPIAGNDGLGPFPIPSILGPPNARLRKVIVTKRFFEANRGNFDICQGNHDVRLFKKHGRLHYRFFCSLIHLPIRSAAQLRMKICLGALAYIAKSDRRDLEGFHWVDMLKIAAKNELSPGMLRGIVANYSIRDRLVRDITVDELLDLGFEHYKFNPLLKEDGWRYPGKLTIDDGLGPIMDALASFGVEYANSGSFTVVEPTGSQPGLVTLSTAHSRDMHSFEGSGRPAGRAPTESVEALRAELATIYASRAWQLTLRVRRVYQLVNRLTGNVFK